MSIYVYSSSNPCRLSHIIAMVEYILSPDMQRERERELHQDLVTAITVSDRVDLREAL